MKSHPLRPVWFCALLIALGLLGLGYWLEHYQGLLPCPLCSLQRFTIMLLALFFIWGTLTAERSRKIHLFIAACTFLAAALGTWLAARQVWLQWSPDHKNADCGVSLQYLLKVLPVDQALLKALEGSAECAKVTWSFLHMSLAEWSCLFFIFFLGLSWIQARKTL